MGSTSLDVLDILECKLKFKVRADNKGLHWLDVISINDNKILYTVFVNKKEYEVLRRWFS